MFLYMLNSYCDSLTENSPSAFELYADLKGKSDDENVRFFKDTFSQDDVKVHFLGAWYVSSRGTCLHKPFIRVDKGIPSHLWD